MSDRETIAAYDGRAADYADRFATAEPTPDMTDFMAVLPKGGKVLDLGCGPGHAAAAFAAAGFDVQAMDASAEMVRIARDRYGVATRRATFDDLDEIAAFDGIWASFSLLHAPIADFDRHLGAIAQALKPGGHLYLGMKTGEGERRDALGRHYAYYQPDDLARRLDAAGFDMVHSHEGADAGLSGNVEPWIVITARKRNA